MKMRRGLLLTLALQACSDEDADGVASTGTTGDPATSGDSGTTRASAGDETMAATSGTSDADSTTGDASDSSGSTGGDDGPMVDVSDPQLHSFAFSADEADNEATQALGTALAYLDTRVEPRGELVVYLHGAGAPETCGSEAMGELLAGMGFHVFMPCYVSDYGVNNCGDDIGGCRLQAFEGVDHHPFMDIAASDAIEPRVVRGLEYLQSLHPGGDWQWFLDGENPRWNVIVISGISHGASSSGLIGMVRSVLRVVMLSGPLDSGQAWLEGDSTTPIDRFYAFTHTDDGQHEGHLQSFEVMGLLGEPVNVDETSPPYDDSHRLVTSAASADGHSSTQAGSTSAQADGQWVFLPVWETMYGAMLGLNE